MEKSSPAWTLGELAEILGGTVSSHPHYIVRRPVPADSDDPEGIAFCESEPYLDRAHAHGVGALILPHSLRSNLKPAIYVEYPRLAYGKLLAMSQRPLPIGPGIHPTAIVHEEAYVSESASIGAYVVIERGARIEDRCKVFAHSYIGEDCLVGNDTTIFPNVVLYQEVSIGNRCIVHSGAVLGADGFGFMWDGKRQVKVPQVGRVEIGDDAEVGANSTVDRATSGTTTVGAGTKLDNLVQIGHNVQLGKDGVLAAATVIGGSSKIGDRVAFGGQCAVSDHIVIVDDVTIGGTSGVPSDLLAKGAYFGRPAIPAAEGLRAYLSVPKLPDMLSRIRVLEKKIRELEDKS
ncbi:MAG: UDP-3-O-(3-hydroxymyristoyl)glucosamine N-acyltransferase [Chlorobia bacterium]|nr:UDP-3-O-(3-hydroxymyristoyl)glucosamine N-acyltransferase [Fimbriimonadaceae bacterium]